VRAAGTRAFALACALTAAPAAIAHASGETVRPGAHLSWVRADGAGMCPDAAAIEAEVAERLGDNPFARAPTQFIEAVVSQKPTGFDVAIAMRASDGTLLGNRSLTSSPGDCRSIATAAALTIAILIDPDALARAPAPKPAPPPSPVPAPPRGRFPAGRVTAIGGGGWGLVPGVSPGAGLTATVDLPRPFAVGLATLFYPESRAAPPDDGFAFGLTYAELVGCVAPLSPDRTARLELCLGATAGVLHAAVFDATATAPGQRWTFGAAQLTRVIIPIPIYAGLIGEIALEATEPLPRRAFFVEGRPPGMDTVFTQPAVTLAGWAGVGVRWK
jgi:hypothetical protein